MINIISASYLAVSCIWTMERISKRFLLNSLMCWIETLLLSILIYPFWLIGDNMISRQELTPSCNRRSCQSTGQTCWQSPPLGRSSSWYLSGYFIIVISEWILMSHQLLQCPLISKILKKIILNVLLTHFHVARMSSRSDPTVVPGNEIVMFNGNIIRNNHGNKRRFFACLVFHIWIFINKGVTSTKILSSAVKS